MCSGWIKDHKKELLAALAVGGTVASAGAFAPAAAAAEGGGLLAGGLGAGAADELAGAGLLASQAPAGNALSIASGNALTGLGLNPDGLGTGLERFGKIAQFGQAAGLGQQPQRPPMMAPPMGVQPLNTQSGIPPLSQTFPTNIVDDERKRRLLALMQQRGY